MFATRSQWSKAETSYRVAISINPKHAFAHLELGEVLSYTGGSLESRRRHFANAVLGAPKSARAQVAFAETLYASNLSSSALFHLQCALRQRPGFKRARRLATRISLEVEDPSSAEMILLPLLKSPDVIDLILAAEVYQKKSSPQLGAEALSLAAIQSQSAAVYRQAAAAWELAGHPKKSENAKQLADKIKPRQQRRMRALPKARR